MGNKIQFQYHYKSLGSDNYEIRELIHDCDPNLTDMENIDNAFTKACELGADPNKNVRWKFID